MITVQKKNWLVNKLKKFIVDNDVYWVKIEANGVTDFVIFPFFEEVRKFTKLIPEYLDKYAVNEHKEFSDIEVKLLSEQIQIHMLDICNFYDIDINEIFDNE